MKLITILSIFLCSFTNFAQESIEVLETTTYFFIRHAEKDTSNPNDRNPNLTDLGKKRASDWAKILADTTIDFVFSTDYYRTQQTAKPIAEHNNVAITSYNPRDLYTTEFQQITKGKTCVIVGHSNTTPTFVNKIIGKNKHADINEKVYGKLFIVTIKNGMITDTVLHIN